jgi:hypothetical protein
MAQCDALALKDDRGMGMTRAARGAGGRRSGPALKDDGGLITMLWRGDNDSSPGRKRGSTPARHGDGSPSRRRGGVVAYNGLASRTATWRKACQWTATRRSGTWNSVAVSKIYERKVSRGSCDG